MHSLGTGKNEPQRDEINDKFSSLDEIEHSCYSFDAVPKTPRSFVL